MKSEKVMFGNLFNNRLEALLSIGYNDFCTDFCSVLSPQIHYSFPDGYRDLAFTDPLLYCQALCEFIGSGSRMFEFKSWCCH